MTRARCTWAIWLAVAGTAATAQSTADPKPAVSNKRYQSSSPPASAKKSSVKSKVAGAARRAIPRLRKDPPVSASTRAEAHQGVLEKVSDGIQIPVESAAALVPFFEQLYRHQTGAMAGALHILHYGDSHTAADEWTGDLRERFQEKFGDGGAGYSLAGRPYRGYRREDVRSGSTRGWHADGLVGKPGDGVYGLGGISMSAKAPHEAVFLLADAQEFELFYLQQPGGGALRIFDNGTPVDRISTNGEMAPAYYRYDADLGGTHRFEIETVEHAPVRLFGWVAENTTGVTYETLGINGAQASMVLDWNEEVLRSNIERRDPALIVLSYGTNEAGRKDWTLETYRETFARLIQRFRAADPTATILVTAPPDRYLRTRKGWVVMDNVDMIVEAERQAAAAEGCAFWDLRAKMGGKGSMRQWVLAGMGQRDYVHFTAPGYRMIGDAMFRDLMSQYDLFLKARDAVAQAEPSESGTRNVTH
jgi:lysophospholipase L1-like esterase